MKFSDPTTSITDYILAVAAFAFGALLLRLAGPYGSTRLWAAAFVAVGVSAASGGFFHHRRLELGPSANEALWRITAIALLCALALFLAAGVLAAAPHNSRIAFLALIGAAFLSGVVWMRRSGGEEFGVKKSVWLLSLVLLALVAALLHQWIRNGAPTGIRILVGSIFCVLGVIVQQSAPRMHRHFNHNDLCHVLFMIGLYFLYQGGLLLRDKA